MKNVFLKAVSTAVAERQAEITQEQEAIARKQREADRKIRAYRSDVRKRERGQKETLENVFQPALNILKKIKGVDGEGNETNAFNINISTHNVSTKGNNYPETRIRLTLHSKNDRDYRAPMFIEIFEQTKTRFCFGIGFVPMECTQEEALGHIAAWATKYAPEQMQALADAAQKRPTGRAPRTMVQPR